MDALIEVWNFVPDRSQNVKGFARKITKELFSQVDMSPTRGGQILTQTLLQHVDSRKRLHRFAHWPQFAGRTKPVSPQGCWIHRKPNKTSLFVSQASQPANPAPGS